MSDGFVRAASSMSAADLWQSLQEANAEIERLRRIETTGRHLAKVYERSVDVGPSTNSPAREAEAWRAFRAALGGK